MFAAPDLPASFLGYTLRQLISEEDEGWRVRATDPAHAPCTALILRPEVSDPATLAELQRRCAAVRASALPGVQSPQIISDGGSKALAVAPQVGGETLAAELARRGRLPWTEALARIASIGERLTALHGLGLDFGGLRPSTALFDSTGAALLLDVGVARNGLGAQGAAFMAPEQTQGTCEHASDLYALAALLHLLVTGRPLFAGALPQLVLMHRFKDPPSLRRALPGLEVSTAAEAAILRALDKRPGERFGSVGEFLRAVEGSGPPQRLRSPRASMPAQLSAANGQLPGTSTEATEARVGAPIEPTMMRSVPLTRSPPEEATEARVLSVERTAIAAAPAAALLNASANHSRPLPQGKAPQAPQPPPSFTPTRQSVEATPVPERPAPPAIERTEICLQPIVRGGEAPSSRRAPTPATSEPTALLAPLPRTAPPEERTSLVPGFGGPRLRDEGRTASEEGRKLSPINGSKPARPTSRPRRALCIPVKRPQLRAWLPRLRQLFGRLRGLRGRVLGRLRRLARLVGLAARRLHR